MKETIRVKITPDGNMEIGVEGVAGKSCTDVTKDLEVTLGQTTKKEFTADYYKQDPKGPEPWITRK